MYRAEKHFSHSQNGICNSPEMGAFRKGKEINNPKMGPLKGLFQGLPYPKMGE